MESVLLATSIAAVTEFLKRVTAKDVSGAVIIAAAAGLGLLAGAFGIDGLSAESGLIAGLGIAGIHTIAQQVG
jgi:hypothetical protein